MTKRFFTKSVALAFFSILVFGFLSFGVVRADTTTNTQALNQAITNPLPANSSAPSTAQLQQLQQSTAINSTSGGGTTYAPTNSNQSASGLPTISGSATSTSLNFNPITSTNGSSTAPPTGNSLIDLGFGIGNLVVNGVPLLAIATFLYAVFGVISACLLIAGLAFDGAINFSILHISAVFSMPSIMIIWTLARDVFNITFIFILLYISITMILGKLTKGAKATLTGVIVSALFINFSMFIAKVLIDFGNIIAVALYNRMGSGASVSLSSIILGLVHLKDILGVLSLSGQANLLLMLVLQIILAFMLMWTFGYGAFIFIGRTIMLLLLTMLSPIGFIGGTLPWLQKYSDSWWKEFTNQILVAPLFLFMIYMVVLLIQDMQTALLATETSFFQTLAPGFSNVSNYLFFMVAIFLLMTGMKLVKEFSNGAGAMALKIVGAAAAVVAAPVALGMAGEGILGEGASAAAQATKEAGGNRVAQIAARLKFRAASQVENLKNLPSDAGKFVTGKYDKTGIGGITKDLIRDNVMSGIKSGTSGSVDPKAIGKWLENREKNTNKAIEDKSKGFTAEANAKKAELDAKNKQITDIANKTEKTTEHEAAEKTHSENEKELKAANENAEKVNNNKNSTASDFSEATARKASAQANFDASSAAVEQFKKTHEDNIDAKKNKLAEDMGHENYAEITEGLKTVAGELKKGQEAQRQYINELEKTSGVAAFVKHGVFQGTVPVINYTFKQGKEMATKLRKPENKKEKLAQLAREVQKEEDDAKAKAEGGGEAKETDAPKPPAK